MQPLTAEEFRSKLTFIATESGKGLLKRIGHVFPFGVSLPMILDAPIFASEFANSGRSA